MVTIQLYDGDISFNNNNIMSNFVDLSAQNTYFNTHADLTLTDDCKFTKYEEPILINKTFDELIQYKYGRINISGFNWVYFSIAKFVMETSSKTWMFIDIDPWETFRYRTNGLVLGRGRVTRSSRNTIYKIITAFKPNVNRYETHTILCEPWYYDVNTIALIHIPTDNTNRIVVFKPTMNGQLPYCITSLLAEVVVNMWNLTNDDIIGVWLSPFEISTPIGNDTPEIDRWTKENTNTNVSPIYWKDYTEFVRSSFGENKQIKTFNLSPSPSDIRTVVITDLTGAVIWSSPNYMDIDEIEFRLNTSLSSVVWHGYIKYNNGYIKEGYFTVPCEPIDVFSDAFSNYMVQQKPFLQETRKLQNEQALVNSIPNIGNTAVMGGIGGNVGGAVGGAVVGVAGAVISYVANEYYNKEYGRVETEQAKVQNDVLRNQGSVLTDIITGVTRCELGYMYGDTQAEQQYLKDIDTYGYFYDVETSLESYIVTDGKLTATTNEVQNVPSIYVGNIQNRLARGVKFINPS